MACGTGKTLTSLFIKEKLDAERTLVLVPSLSLLKQTMQVWRANAKVPFEALPVCSDETVDGQSEDAAVAPHQRAGCARHHRPCTRSPRSCGGGRDRVWCSRPTSPPRRSPTRSPSGGCRSSTS